MTNRLVYLFGSELKARLLETLLLNPQTAYHLRGLAAAAHVESGNASKALRGLVQAQFVKTVSDVRGVRYQANERSPLFEPLRLLFVRAGELVADLKGVADQLPAEQVLVYGSVAKGMDTADSDVDVLVVGDLSGIEAQAAFQPVARKHHREINVLTMDRKTIGIQTAQGSGFWRDIAENEVIMLKGDKFHVANGTPALA